MGSYIDAWKRYRDFSGKSSRYQFWMAEFVHTLMQFVLVICLAFGIAIWSDLTPDGSYTAFQIIFSLYRLLFLVPGLALTVRRLRDAGYTAKSFFWLFIPVIGGIAFFARLCTKSADEQTNT